MERLPLWTPSRQPSSAVWRIAAFAYIRHKRLRDCNFRFDVVLIESGQVEWIPNAFDAPEPWTV